MSGGVGLPVNAQERTDTSAGGSAKQAADVWDTLLPLPPGTRLRLLFRDGSEVTGTLVETRADAVVMSDNEEAGPESRLLRESRVTTS